MSAFRRSISLVAAISHLALFGLVGIPSAAFAQSDLEPPTIEFERIAEGIRGETQVFSATVADEVSVESVTLHYRFGDDTTYVPIGMTPLNGTDIYTVSVETAGAASDILQYYVEARDAAGNRSIQGFAFDPIERQLIDPPARAAVETDSTAAPAPAPPPPRANGMSTGRKVLYGVLGVLAVGAIVAVAGSSDSGGSSPAGDDPDTPNVPFDIIVNPLP